MHNRMGVPLPPSVPVPLVKGEGFVNNEDLDPGKLFSGEDLRSSAELVTLVNNVIYGDKERLTFPRRGSEGLPMPLPLGRQGQQKTTIYLS